MTNVVEPRWTTRHALGLIALAALGPTVLGSFFNIWYNVIHIEPLLTAEQQRRFHRAIVWYNLGVYPVGVGIWVWLVFSMGRAYHGRLRGEAVDPAELTRAQRRAVNLPWHIAFLLAAGWLGCVPAFLGAVAGAAEPMHENLPAHLTISLVIAALISVTHSMLLLELLAQRWLFPVLFGATQPYRVRGAATLTLRQRGLLLAVSAVVCPIVSLLLLGMVDHGQRPGGRWFMLTVGVVGIAFGLASTALMSRLVVGPVHALRDAAGTVAAGDLGVRLRLLRADEFGPLIDEFNHMVGEMRAKQELRQTFGLHVGERAAEVILRSDPGLGGRNLELTVLFCDIRGFTSRSAGRPPHEVVRLLNRFFTAMVEAVEEEHDGMINKFLGDGFVALFNAAGDQPDHASRAVDAAERMLQKLETLNADSEAEGGQTLAIGVGIHTGRAIVGNIGSQQRLEYTAIGETVNLASRVEGLTKKVGEPILLTDATRARLSADRPLRPLTPQPVAGLADPVAVYAPDGVGMGP